MPSRSASKRLRRGFGGESRGHECGMADDERDDADEPWGEGPEHPPLTDIENPLDDKDDGEGKRDADWMPPVP
jgi:hypothetical protein